jgi:hypothetical protein
MLVAAGGAGATGVIVLDVPELAETPLALVALTVKL